MKWMDTDQDNLQTDFLFLLFIPFSDFF